MGTPGSASGLEKRTRGNTSTALQADSTVRPRKYPLACKFTPTTGSGRRPRRYGSQQFEPNIAHNAPAPVGVFVFRVDIGMCKVR